jgi:GalNAc-alpha-(1->4)-GalNAc-alpha-(1->3)-diNAcBac-PP-undecaprenol alpha-1,4-N-acetyl-D-galactosaminyltransferase
MRIALTIHALFGGGAERLMSQLADWWSAAGHEIHLITWAEVDTDVYRIPPSVHRIGLGHLRTSRGPWSGIRANFLRCRSLRATLKQIQPDFILSFCDQMNIVTLQATRGLEIPTWIAEHSNPEKQRLSRFWEVWRGHTYPRCSGCVVLSPAIGEYMRRWIPRDRIVVIPNAIAPPPSEFHGEGKGDDQPPQPNTSTMLAVGRLSHEKGMDVLIAAWKLIQPQLPDWHLQIAGEGPERQSLEHASQGVKSIIFLGWVKDPWPLYRGASLFVMPSRYEGFPVALIEAMSQGLACIATHCSEAVDELSRDGTGLEVVASESPTQLAEAIYRLATNPNRRQQLGETARETSANYSWSRIGPQWDRLLTTGSM